MNFRMEYRLSKPDRKLSRMVTGIVERMTDSHVEAVMFKGRGMTYEILDADHDFIDLVADIIVIAVTGAGNSISGGVTEFNRGE